MWNSGNRYEIEDLHSKTYFLVLFFSIVHISTNIVLRNLKFRVLVGKIAVEGTTSQNFVLGFRFCFMQKKTGNF